MTKIKVLASTVTFGKINKEPKERMETLGWDVVTNPYGRPLIPEEFSELGVDADALIVGNDKITADIINRCPNVKIIAKHGIGVDAIDIKYANSKGIYVTNAPGSNATEVADLAVAYMINLARGIVISNRDTKAGKWNKPKAPMCMNGKTVGIVGTGHIGCQVASRLRGFNMNLLGYDIFENAEAKSFGVKYVPLDELLLTADYITLHLPLLEETQHLLNEERIAHLKHGVVIVNTARCQLVDYTALETALKSGLVRGYAADVFEHEPPEHLPLYDLDNVIVTAHIGGTTKESNLRMGNMAVDNVIAALTGKIPPNVLKA
ncbi:phosphoglycerate dehydrogenase [Megasphaera sueciensis]|uniref:phosphoglycerate dehydrogenase n=1 Tax=Megasphaera sueciensis TaxID=349094 RepID=UPI003D0411EE